MNYREIKDEQPVLNQCFLAFSNQQMAEGIEKAGIKGMKIYSGGMGLYGTKEGIKELFDYYDAQSKRIGEECDPQEVYAYEYGNHECGYTCDDAEAMKIVIGYFGEERAKEIKRKHGYYSIETLTEEMGK